MTPSKNSNIFISIASYRDPELIPTIKDCLAKAKHPEKLFFGICWQRDENENLDEFINHPQFRFYTVDWKESKGACWARHIIQKNLYQNEGYFLQLDSHHRFIEHWDEHLKYLYYASKSPKPIIGTYGTTYWPEKPEEPLKNEPYRIISFDTFTDDGDLISRPQLIKKHKDLSSNNIDLIPARLLSGHFIFTQGLFCRECIYDPNLYFRGEEITLSARAYTHGYDLFHPTYTVIWHEYLRPKQHKHWDDHVPSNGFVLQAEDRNVRSKERQRKLFKMDDGELDFRHYGLGKKRSLHEYELYCGVDFKNRKVHKNCAALKDGIVYPEPYVMTENEWASGMLENNTINVTWDLNLIPDNKEFDFWFFGFEDENNNLLWRKDFSKDEPYYQNIFHKKQNSHRASFGTEQKPHHCVIIPYIKNHGWADKILINI